jgi:hypothetical protein
MKFKDFLKVALNIVLKHVFLNKIVKFFLASLEFKNGYVLYSNVFYFLGWKFSNITGKSRGNDSVKPLETLIYEGCTVDKLKCYHHVSKNLTLYGFMYFFIATCVIKRVKKLLFFD